mmetsp:Transcript_27068/g.58777  ORF Transcript_27068/g.58777 Transcript_27068/m.58777 type:complete len:283 (-) Transcript_27068:445-1293(-)
MVECDVGQPRIFPIEASDVSSFIEQIKAKCEVSQPVDVLLYDETFKCYACLESLASLPPGSAKVKLASKFATQSGASSSFVHIRPGELHKQTKIGEGGFKTVFRGTYRHMDVAIAEAKNADPDEDELREFDKELSILADLNAPNIVQLIGGVVEPGHNMAIVTEFMPKGSLYDVLERERATLDEHVKHNILKDICQGLAFLHSSNITHGDMKSLNILITTKYDAKLTDFGLSKFRSEEESVILTQGSECKSYPWIAPEQIQPPFDPYRADVWSMGAVFYEVF